MALASLSIHLVQQAPQIGCHQCLCPVSMLLLGEALQKQQVGLNYNISKLLLLFWLLKHVRYCVYPLIVESLLSMEPYMCMVSHSEMSNSLRPPWTVVHQTLLSMGFSRQEYWSGLPFPLPGYLPDPSIEPTSAAPALAGRFFATEPPEKPLHNPVGLPELNSTGLQMRLFWGLIFLVQDPWAGVPSVRLRSLDLCGELMSF